MPVLDTFLDAMGNTPLVRLHAVTQGVRLGSAEGTPVRDRVPDVKFDDTVEFLGAHEFLLSNLREVFCETLLLDLWHLFFQIIWKIFIGQCEHTRGAGLNPFLQTAVISLGFLRKPESDR
jgi:hypothetical protein